MKPIVCFLLLYFARLSLVLAQYLPGRTVEDDERLVQQATLIFEGQAVKMTESYDAAQQRVYRTSTISIAHVLKGAEATNPIRVTYNGPKISSVKVDKATGVLSYELPDDTGHGPAGNNGLMLPTPQPIVFFCRPRSAASPPTPRRRNGTPVTQSLELLGIGYEGSGDGYNYLSDLGGKFATKQAFLDYLETLLNQPAK